MNVKHSLNRIQIKEITHCTQNMLEIGNLFLILKVSINTRKKVLKLKKILLLSIQ